MLREAWDYLRADCAPGVRTIGLAHEAVALAARARRQREAWQTHLDNTRRHLLAVARRSKGGTAVILGSGTCIDVPVAELGGMFERVVLVDAVQLAAARALARRFANVVPKTIDISGAIAPLLACRRPIDDHALDALDFHAPADDLEVTRADFVASVNLLSQLPLSMASWLQQRPSAPSLAAINRFSWRIIDEHVRLLRSAPGRVAVLADACQRSSDGTGSVTTETRPLDPLGLDAGIVDRWQWPVAPSGERSDGEVTTHEVVAITW
jgi:hypothetical protein